MPRLAKPLTEIQVRNAKPRERSWKLFDGGGLYIEVPVVGTRRWRFKYKFEGREKLISFGTYPDVSLTEARERREDARKLVRNGQDPSAVRKSMRPGTVAARTFRAVADEWLDKKSDAWTPSHVVRVRTSLEQDVFPAIGDRDVAAIQPADMLAVVRAVEARGALDVAARVVQRSSNVFRYAVITGLATSNPASELGGVVKQRRVAHRAALAASEIPQFVRKLAEYDGRPETRLGLRLLMLTFVRTGELRGAFWSEVDIDNAEWRIPAERMKMREPHVVPLSKQAVTALRELRKFTGWSEFLFPGTGHGKKPISENTLLYALYRMGYHGRATGHGFRALASTCLNELGWKPDVIERQLAHAERNKVRAAYNRASYMQERKKMMQAWADYIDAQSKKVVPLKRSG